MVLSEGPGAAGVCLTEAWVVLSEAGVGVGVEGDWEAAASYAGTETTLRGTSLTVLREFL